MGLEKYGQSFGSSSYSVTCAVGSVHPSLSKALKKWTSGGGGGRAPWRLILGLGVSFWTQYMSMAGGSVGGNSFTAFARQKGAVEEVIFHHSFT